MAATRLCCALLFISVLMILSTVNASTKAETLATFLPKEHVCHGKYDVAVILDRSRRVSREVFTKYVDFIKNKLIHLFGVEEGGSHFGLVYYNNNPQVAMKFNENNNATFIKHYLMTNPPRRQGGRNLQRALRSTRKELLTEAMGDRPDAPNICLLFTTEAGSDVRSNPQFPKIKEDCREFMLWRLGDYDDPHNVQKRLCPPLSDEEAKKKTIDLCKELFTCNSTYYNDLTETCEEKTTHCPLPFVKVGEYCFYPNFFEMTFNETSMDCMRRNGSLVQVDTQEKSDALTEYIISLMIDSIDFAFYIGLMDVTGNNGDYEWIVDGSNLTFSNWAYQEPTLSSRRCVFVLISTLNEFYRVGQWLDVECGQSFGGICEIDPIY